MTELRVLLYSKSKKQRILFSDNDSVMTTEIEQTFMSHCDVLSLRHTGARINVSDKTIDALQVLQAKYDQATGFHIRKLLGFVRNLSMGEYFYYFNEEKTSVAERRTAIACLTFENMTNKFSVMLHNKIFEHFCIIHLLFEYHSYGFDGLEEWIGEADEKKRVCRFCGKSVPDVSFKKVAHAIQDALGNKLLFCYEECDTCNHDLAVVEDQFRVMMDFRRSIFRIPRKGTTKAAKVVGKDFIIVPDKNGDPILHLMKEAIPLSVSDQKPFAHHFELKSPIVNEQMYKALCKMVIDMLPTRELSHFQNTIKWIKSKDFIPDTLPSIWLVVLTDADKNYIPFKHPVLDVFINNRQEDLKAPYCTGIIWIYDIAYVFIIPFVDIDNGAYKYDSDLSDHWEKIKQWMGFDKWQRQDTTNRDLSTPWIDWIVNPIADDVVIQPKSDDIFSECLTKKSELKDVVMPEFKPEYLSVVKMEKIHFESLYYGSINDRDLRDITMQITGPTFEIIEDKELITVSMNIEANDTTNTIKYFKCSFAINVHIDNFADYVHFTNNADGMSFTFHYQLRDVLLAFALHHSETNMRELRKGTPFEKCTLEKLFSNLDVIASRVVYHILVENGTYVIKDSSIHKKSYYEN